MISLPASCIKNLERYDSIASDISVDDPSYEVKRLMQDETVPTEAHRKAAFAEVAALQSTLAPAMRKSRWGVRYAPIIEAVREDQSVSCFPDLAKIDSDVIEYLEQRASTAKHPVLKSRYADFVWDVSKAATGKKPSIELARSAIDAYVETGKQFPNSSYLEERLSRALELSLAIRDTARTSNVIDTIISLLDSHKYAGEQALWINQLFLNQKSAPITGPQQHKVIQALERKLDQICASEAPVGIVAEEFAVPLAEHYERCGQPEDSKRVIRKYGEAVTNFSAGAAGMVAMAWLQDAYAHYVRFGLAAETDGLQQLAKIKGKEAEGSLVRHTVSVEIPNDEIEKLREEITADDLPTSLRRVAFNFFPRIEQLEKQVETASNKTDLLMRVQQTILSDHQVTATVGPLEDDREGRLILAMQQHLQFTNQLLQSVMDRVRQLYDVNAGSLVDILAESPVFDESALLLCQRGLEAYLSDDHIAAAHILIPRIEDAFRKLLGLLGVATNKHRRSDTQTMVEKSLNDILEQESVNRNYFGEDLILYFRAVLIDPRGPNLRNRMAHGLIDASQFRRGLSEQLLHILWTLSQVRLRPTDSDSEQGDDSDQ